VLNEIDAIMDPVRAFPIIIHQKAMPDHGGGSFGIGIRQEQDQCSHDASAALIRG
jgi:hypothetical protein